MTSTKIPLAAFISILLFQSVRTYAAPIDLSSFEDKLRTGTWTEVWPGDDGEMQIREVTAEIWTDVFQAAITKNKSVHIPNRKKPYYIDGPLVLRSGDRVTAALNAEIRLKPGTNTCMVRNENVVGFTDTAVPKQLNPDANIIIEGGIWTTLATGDRKFNGNGRGHSSKLSHVKNTHGVILLHNVRDVRVQNVTIRQSRPFGIHLGNITNFTVDGVTLDRQGRDGVHVNGPASHGIIRNVGGTSHDDTVALNAWEWRNYAPSYGPIHHIQIEHITGVLNAGRSSNSIRLLPGVKRFADGKTLNCPIHDITLRHLTDIQEYKFYDQPNLEHGRDNDFSVELGTLRNISIQHLVFNKPATINIAASVEQLSIKDVDLRFEPTDDYRLVEIGPMSMTWKSGPDPDRWAEIFSPDRDVLVKGFSLDRVSIHSKPQSDVESRFLQVRNQSINTDYPNTTPRGGTGKAVLIR